MNHFRQAINRILRSRVFIALSIIVSVAAVGISYYRRHILRASFQGVYAISMLMLLLSFLVFLFTYLDREAELPQLKQESVSGLSYFISFLLITVILRG